MGDDQVVLGVHRRLHVAANHNHRNTASEKPAQKHALTVARNRVCNAALN